MQPSVSAYLSVLSRDCLDGFKGYSEAGEDGMTVGGGHTRSNPLEPWHSVAAETNGTNDSVTDIQKSIVHCHRPEMVHLEACLCWCWCVCKVTVRLVGQTAIYRQKFHHH